MTFTVLAMAQTAGTGTITGRVLNASNGSYLSKALVTIPGTNVSTLTNDFGEYTLRDVPAGNVQVQYSFTGLAAKTENVSVTSGVGTTVNVSLGGGMTAPDGTVLLDAFVVESQRYKTAADVAINEERRSVNIKNVVSADQFGDIPSGNVGEFLKYLPGVELEYGGTYVAPTDAFGISVRGFGPADTNIMIDGVPISSAPQASLTTQVGLDMLSINNASRIELIKVPTPDMPMNSVGGQINLISKSAFEYAKPTFNWRTYVTINSEHPNPFEKIPGPGSKEVFAGQPGFELSYIKPINEKLGFTVSASSYSQFSENRRYVPQWRTTNTVANLAAFGLSTSTTLANAQGPISLANPFLTRVDVRDAPRTSTTHTASLKGDWKPFNGLAVSGAYTFSLYEASDNMRRIQIRTEAPMTWDANHVISYPFRSAAQSANGVQFTPANTSLEMTPDGRDKEGSSHTGYIKATYRRGPWDIYAMASASTSRASFKDLENGHFSTLDFRATIGQVKFEDIRDGLPGRITVLDRNGQVLDFTKMANWATPEMRVRSGNAESMDDKFLYQFDIKRDLDFLPWDEVKLAVKTGVRRDETLQKKWGLGVNYGETYTGPALALQDYLDPVYSGIAPGWGFGPQEWPSLYKLYDYYQANRSQFTITESDAVNNWNNLVGQNKSIKETTDAWYAQVEGSALKNRLNFVGGLRDETKKRTGRGTRVDSKWNFIKNPDGTLYRNDALLGAGQLLRIDQANSLLFAQTATGNAVRADLTSKGIAFPTAIVPNNSLAMVQRFRQLLVPVYGKSEGKPSYSFNVAYDITDKLVGKLAWSRTYGRVPIEDGNLGLLTSGNNFQINEAESTSSFPRGTITVANPNLIPEISDNWDFNLTYYTDRGGKIGGTFYTKNIKNFQEQVVISDGVPEFDLVVSSLGLDPADFIDWNVTTAINGVGTGKVKGFELEAFQDLRVIPWLGDWGRRTTVFATYTKSKRSESNTTRISARPSADQLATAGINLATNRFSVNLRATWQDTKFLSGQGTFVINGQTIQLGEYEPSVTKVDATVSYQITPKYAVYASGKNILESGLRRDRFDLAGVYPAYAHWADLREFGVMWTIGIRGSF
jgi:iron complex outermembrane recepter protein